MPYSREHSLLENRTYITGPIFHLYRVFLPPVQMIAFVAVGSTERYKCPLTKTRRGLIQPTWYKCLTFVPIGGSARYKYEASTLVPGEATAPGLNSARYKCSSHPRVIWTAVT
jgi:hypothetical protein